MPMEDPQPKPGSPSSFTYSRFRAVLFNDLLDPHPGNRSRALDNIVQIVSEWARVVTDHAEADLDSSLAQPTPPFSPHPQDQDSTITTGASLQRLSISTTRTGSQDQGHPSQVEGAPVPSSPLQPRSRVQSQASSSSPLMTLPGGLSSHSASSSSSYHFQNDPDLHFNWPIPEKLSPLEERVAEVDEAGRLLRHHILTILRFSICCPYKDVKLCLVGLLAELESLSIPIPKPIHDSASFFIDSKDLYMLDSPQSSRCPSPSLTPKDRSSSSSSLSTLPQTLALARLPPAVGCVPDEATKEIMTRTFLNYGRSSNLFRILAFFPSFWEKFELSYRTMMNGSGPIPKPWRCYVAIMAASQYNCQYMVSMMKLDFLTSGGDPTWLNGIQFTTQKIRSLAKLNGLMAHQPWKIKQRHIRELVCRKVNHNPHNAWTISELTQVMVIFSTLHSISIFVAACGIVPEIDMVGGTFVDLTKLYSRKSHEEAMMSPLSMLPSPKTDLDPPSTDLQDPERADPVDSARSFHFHITLPPMLITKKTYDPETSKLHTAELIQRLLKERESCGSECEDGDGDEEEGDLGLPRGFVEIEDTFPSLESKVMSPPLSSSWTGPHVNQEADRPIRPVQEDMSRFLDMSCQVEPSPFDCHSSQYKVFRVDEFRWEDDGSALLFKCLPELGEHLEDEFTETLNFTDLSFFDENMDQHADGIDTFAFRQAIWFYTLRLFGLFHQDYNYRHLSRFMNLTLAGYIRKVCYGITMVEGSPTGTMRLSGGSMDSPEPLQSPPKGPLFHLSDQQKVDRNDFENIGFELRPEERCHINIIVMEASKQAKLLYALRAVDRWERRASGVEDEEDTEEEECF